LLASLKAMHSAAEKAESSRRNVFLAIAPVNLDNLDTRLF
jgi:hypothetical protein